MPPPESPCNDKVVTEVPVSAEDKVEDKTAGNPVDELGDKPAEKHRKDSL